MSGPELEEKERILVDCLKRNLINFYSVFIHTQLICWKLSGDDAFSLRSTFERQYRELFVAVDQIAERLRAYGEEVPGNLRELIYESGRKLDDQERTQLERINYLLEENCRLYSDVVRSRDAAVEIQDAQSAEFLNERMQVHGRSIWFLESYIEANTESPVIQKSSGLKPLIGVCGASGFVGTHLIDHLKGQYRFRALTRSPNIVAAREREGASVEWRQCDLYSLPNVTDELLGCDLAIYLVHSMAPSSRLVQGEFEDTDLLLADNFIRGAQAAGVKHVVYLSGLMPDEDHFDDVSSHLRSRWEVERVIRSRGVQVTVLRAGLIFGPGGSSFCMLINLVRSLPVMLLPAWANSVTQSIDIEDVCRAFELCLSEPEFKGETFDIGGHEPMTYQMLIESTAYGLGKKMLFFSFPYNCFNYTKYFISYLGKVPVALVGPLQESLKYDLVAKPNLLLKRLKSKLVPLNESLKRSVDEHGRPLRGPRSKTNHKDRKDIKKARLVRSVQRMPYPHDWNAGHIAAEYANFLTRHFRGLISAKIEPGGVVCISMFCNKLTLLELTQTPFSIGKEHRCAFYITGGWLTRKVEPKGRLEFRVVPELNCVITSLHGFAPMLPWWIYSLTQAKLHLRVVRQFGEHMDRLVLLKARHRKQLLENN